MALSWVSKVAVDAAAESRVDNMVAALLIGGLAMGAVQTCFNWQGNLQRLVSDKVSMELDQEILVTLDSIPGVAHLESPDHLDQVELVLDKGRDISAALWASTDVASTVGRLALTGDLLAAIDPLLLLLPVAVVPMLFATARANPIRFAVERDVAAETRMRDALHDLTLEQTAAMELKIFGAAGALSDRSTQLGRAVQRRRLRAGLRAGALVASGWLGLGIMLGFALFLTAQRVTEGEGTSGDLVLVSSLALATLFAIRGLLWRAEIVQRSLEVLDRYMALRTYAEAQRAEWVEPARSKAPDELRHGIALRGLSFSYPAGDGLVLEDVSLDLPAGSVVALVGDNGAGKSTLVKILLGHYRPTSGQLLIDGVPIERVDPSSWRARTSATYQDFCRLEGLLRQTVGLGDVERMTHDSVVFDALERAATSDIVTRWPDGLATRLGKTYQDGLQPSGGQWQRLAIARSFMRERPLLFIFDEPTAAIDPLHEAELLSAYADAARQARDRGESR